ncbi:MAG: DEAD/DEAH box helicase [Acidobacteria bacterium]|nr:DEAD/DEAH box helicase [Acidobacteriota bacterium]
MSIVPAAPSTFADLGLSPVLCHALVRLGYAQPTPVQAASIPIVLTGRDLFARAQTGTGKTAAFALPMIDRLHAATDRAARPRGPRGLVLVPTRELAVQVDRAVARYGATARVRTAVIFGGVSMVHQLRALAQRPDIVVATPGRLIDHVQRRSIDLSAVEILVVDEADRMMDVGFLPAIRRLTAALPKDRQTLLFSATLPRDVVALAADMTRSPEHVDVGEKMVAPTVTHHVHPVADHRKPDLLARVLAQAPVGQALVFCRTKRGSDRVGRHLDGLGIATSVIHGNKSQSARTRALDGFRTGRVRVLVATDIAARGLDIAQLPLVVNYDLPMVAQDYVHRIGRTGRAGVTGRAVSLVGPNDRDMLSDIERLVRTGIERVSVEGFEAGAEQARPAPPTAFRRHSSPRGPAGRRRFGARPARRHA